MSTLGVCKEYVFVPTANRNFFYGDLPITKIHRGTEQTLPLHQPIVCSRTNAIQFYYMIVEFN